MSSKRLEGVLTINYTKDNTFMKAESNPSLRRYNEEGEQLSSDAYIRNVAPRTQSFRRIPWSYKNREYLVNLEDKQLNEVVEEIGLTYPEGHRLAGEIITEANRRNRKDPFFSHTDLNIMFESGQTSLHPDDPKHFLFYKSMEIDPRYRIAGKEKEGLHNAKAEFTIRRSGEDNKDKVKNVKQTIEATRMLAKMDFEKQKKVMRAMGVSVQSVDPDILEATLYEKITEYKDIKSTPGGPSNIEAFMRFAVATNEDLTMLEIITEAEAQGVIFRKSGNRYFYGDILLGTSKESVINFLTNTENDTIQNEIIESTNLD